MMKKNYLWMAAMASLLSFTACSDDASPIEMPENPGEVVMDDGTTIELAVSNTGIGTRAARPVGSSAAANNVNKVKLMFYFSSDKGNTWNEAKKSQGGHKEDVVIEKITGVKNPIEKPVVKNNVIDFGENIHEAGNKKNHIEESYKVKLKGLEADKLYRIVAYGYNGKVAGQDATTDQFPYGTEIAATGADAKQKGLMQTGEHTKSGYDLEEVFAGCSEKATNPSAKFPSTPKVTISRQVAGILAYFKIPTKVNDPKTGALVVVKTVKVFANDKSKGFKFPATLLGENKAFNGIDDDKATTGEELMVFDMETASTNYNNGNPTDEYYKTRNDDLDQDFEVTNATGIATGYKKPNKLVLKANTFFGARYILPYAADATGNTLQVKMYSKDDANTPVKTLTVTTNQPVAVGNYKDYDIRCNNFYSIGKKYASGNTEGKPDPDPENPEPTPDPEGPDEPIDLGASDQIIVEINDAWEILHNMDVEEE